MSLIFLLSWTLLCDMQGQLLHWPELTLLVYVVLVACCGNVLWTKPSAILGHKSRTKLLRYSVPVFCDFILFNNSHFMGAGVERGVAAAGQQVVLLAHLHKTFERYCGSSSPCFHR